MSTLDNTQALIRKFEPMLHGLTKEELLLLNKMIVEKIKLMNKASAIVSMVNLHIGDRVSWQSKNGEKKVGIIFRMNQKTASVRTQTDEYWNVSPQLLTKES